MNGLTDTCFASNGSTRLADSRDSFTIWSRYLALIVGHGAYAQVLVLAVFLGGLALGALYVVGDLPRDVPLFAVARMAGWAAHYVEELDERPVRFRGMARPR